MLLLDHPIDGTALSQYYTYSPIRDCRARDHQEDTINTEDTVLKCDVGIKLNTDLGTTSYTGHELGILGICGNLLRAFRQQQLTSARRCPREGQ